MDRDLDSVREMLTLIRQTLEDGKIREEEAESLRVWLKHHPDMVVTGLGREIAEKVVAVFEDRLITGPERHELLGLLRELVGQDQDEE